MTILDPSSLSATTRRHPDPQNHRASRSPSGSGGPVGLTAPTTLTLARAINAGLRQAMIDDPKVILLGEDIGALGGVFRVTADLLAEFGPHRVIDTPLAEAAIVGAAVGLAYRGYRPVCEIQFDGFIFPAFDQIVSQVAKLHYRTQGCVRMPITIRVPFGGGIGAAEHHSESPEAYFTHTSGLRVIAVSDPQDAYSQLRQAITSDDPVLYFEPKRRYHLTGEVIPRLGPPMEQAIVVTTGSAVTLVAYGALVAVARDAALAAADEGVSIEVIDLRSLSPVDYATVEASVRKTGRLVVTHEAAQSGGIGGEIVASITERCFEYLEAAPVRVTGFDIPYPAARLERHHLPDLDRILAGVDRALGR